MKAGVKNSQHSGMGQNCGKNTSELLKTHHNSTNSILNTTKDQSVPEKTEYDLQISLPISGGATDGEANVTTFDDAKTNAHFSFSYSNYEYVVVE